MGKKLILVGLVEPDGPDMVEAFKEWYLGNHIEDTYNCPNITAVTCYKGAKGFMGDVPSGYLTIYEFEGEDAVAAEAILGAYQSDPNSWDQRMENNNSMKIVSAGWYHEEKSFGHDD